MIPNLKKLTAFGARHNIHQITEQGMEIKLEINAMPWGAYEECESSLEAFLEWSGVNM